MSTSRWMAPYTSIQRIMAPPTAGPCMMKVRGIGGSAIHAALMTALTRLLTRFLLAATLLLLAGLLPAATLLLIRARVALLRLVRLWLVRVAHALSPQGLTGLPLDVNAWNRRKLRRKTSMRVRISRNIDANFRQNFAAN